MKPIALLWNRGMHPLSIIACLVLEHKGKSRSSALTGNSDWTGSWGDLGGVWHLALPFDEYFRKFWYLHLQWFQRSTDNCGNIHVRIILGHPIGRHWQSWAKVSIHFFISSYSRATTTWNGRLRRLTWPGWNSSQVKRHSLSFQVVVALEYLEINTDFCPWLYLLLHAVTFRVEWGNAPTYMDKTPTTPYRLMYEGKVLRAGIFYGWRLRWRGVERVLTCLIPSNNFQRA